MWIGVQNRTPWLDAAPSKDNNMTDRGTEPMTKGVPLRGFKDWYMALMNWVTTAISGKMQEKVVI